MSPLSILAIAWYAAGVAGFLWWWTQDEPLDRHALAEACMAGVLGPVTLLLGLCVHRLMDADPIAKAGEAHAPSPSIPLQTRPVNHVHPIAGSPDHRADRS